MLNTETLREVLKEIYAYDDEHLLPIAIKGYIPDVSLNEKRESYIGYRIISKWPTKPEGSVITVNFRISLVGDKAEETADSILFWKVNKKVNKILDSYGIVLNLNDIREYSIPIKDDSAEMAWIVDMSAESDYVEKIKLLDKENRQPISFRSLLITRSR